MQEIAIGVQKVVKQPLNSVNGIEHQEGPKKNFLYRNIACNSTNHKRFCCCRNIISNSTKQLHPNHQSNNDVVLLSTAQYIQHKGNFLKCTIVVQTCIQQLGDE